MKVLPFKIPKPGDENLTLQIDKGLAFYDKVHQHAEIQISYIVSGEGKILVSDSVNAYAPDDVIVIAGDTPHLFQSNIIENQTSEMISLFFTKESFGESFFQRSELKEAAYFFEQLSAGFKISNGIHQLRPIFLELVKVSVLKRFISLLELMQQISQLPKVMLSSHMYPKNLSNTEGQKMQTIFEYAFRNFQNEITLDHISNLIFMTPNAFCKYFKSRTNKTFFQFLIELRLAHAGQLLIQHRDLSISDVAFQSGFTSISHFNRKFRSFYKKTPRQFGND